MMEALLANNDNFNQPMYTIGPDGTTQAVQTPEAAASAEKKLIDAEQTKYFNYRGRTSDANKPYWLFDPGNWWSTALVRDADGKVKEDKDISDWEAVTAMGKNAVLGATVDIGTEIASMAYDGDKLNKWKVAGMIGMGVLMGAACVAFPAVGMLAAGVGLVAGGHKFVTNLLAGWNNITTGHKQLAIMNARQAANGLANVALSFTGAQAAGNAMRMKQAATALRQANRLQSGVKAGEAAIAAVRAGGAAGPEVGGAAGAMATVNRLATQGVDAARALGRTAESSSGLVQRALRVLKFSKSGAKSAETTGRHGAVVSRIAEEMKQVETALAKLAEATKAGKAIDNAKEMEAMLTQLTQIAAKLPKDAKQAKAAVKYLNAVFRLRHSLIGRVQDVAGRFRAAEPEAAATQQSSGLWSSLTGAVRRWRGGAKPNPGAVTTPASEVAADIAAGKVPPTGEAVGAAGVTTETAPLGGAAEGVSTTAPTTFEAVPTHGIDLPPDIQDAVNAARRMGLPRQGVRTANTGLRMIPKTAAAVAFGHVGPAGGLGYPLLIPGNATFVPEMIRLRRDYQAEERQPSYAGKAQGGPDLSTFGGSAPGGLSTTESHSSGGHGPGGGISQVYQGNRNGGGSQNWNLAQSQYL